MASINIVFSEAVYGLDRADLTLSRSGVNVPLTASQEPTTTNHVTWTVPNLSGLTAMAGNYALTIVAAGSGVTDAAGNTLAGNATDAWATNSRLTGRQIFYNNSSFDLNNAAANAADDAAIATNKLVLLPGATATFANYTSYDKGINGLMLDVAGLRSTPTVSDFQFRVGNDNRPYGGNLNDPADDWPWAPAPASITVRAGAGLDGADRVTLIWADSAIRNCWLQVIVRATDRTGLAAKDVFYVGNAVGEAGNSTADAIVNATDEIGAKQPARALQSGVEDRCIRLQPR